MHTTPAFSHMTNSADKLKVKVLAWECWTPDLTDCAVGAHLSCTLQTLLPQSQLPAPGGGCES